MTRNYRADVVGRPYVRVDKISISYNKPNEAVITFNEVEAILTDSGEVLKIKDIGTFTMNVNPWDMDVDLQIVHPATAQDIPGLKTNYQNVMLGILAALRKNQKERDDGVIDLGAVS